MTTHSDAERVGTATFRTPSGNTVLAAGDVYRQPGNRLRGRFVATAFASGTCTMALFVSGDGEFYVSLSPFLVSAGGQVEAEFSLKQSRDSETPPKPEKTWRDRAIEDPVFW